ENLSPRLARPLAEEGHDVLFVPTSALRGSPDRALHDVAVEEERVVITRDLRFSITNRLPGIILVRAGTDAQSSARAHGGLHPEPSVPGRHRTDHGRLPGPGPAVPADTGLSGLSMDNLPGGAGSGRQDAFR